MVRKYFENIVEKGRKYSENRIPYCRRGAVFSAVEDNDMEDNNLTYLEA